MSEPANFPVSLSAADVPPRQKASNYPARFAARVATREKRPLGDRFGLTNFGVNHTRLPPGAISALRHAHAAQDEFVYRLAGTPTLGTDAGRTPLKAGDCAGFRKGTGDAHCLINESDSDVVYLEVGDRSPGDVIAYPDDDLRADWVEGGWRFAHKDGTPY